jgi:hypothetical protein
MKEFAPLLAVVLTTILLALEMRKGLEKTPHKKLDEPRQ